MIEQSADTWARDLATEAKELAVRVSVMQEAHERACDERHADMRKWQEESVRTRHDLHNNMLGGFGELRASIAAVAADVQTTADAATTRWLAVGATIILTMLAAIGYLIANKGLG